MFKSLLNRKDKIGTLAVTTAIVRVFENQTKEERDNSITIERNNKGFNAIDAKLGTYLALYALNGVSPENWDIEVKKKKSKINSPIRVFSGHFLEKARVLAIKYSGQLKIK